MIEEVRIRTSRRLGLFALALGALGLVVILLFDPARRLFYLAVVAALLLSGLLVVLDRRVKLAISEAGIRYSRWGPAVLPWHEFAGYRWTRWRQQPQLQLLPRRPSELVAGFSPYGKLNHFCYQVLRMPPFSIAAARLEVDDARLEELVARYLPEQPAGV